MFRIGRQRSFSIGVLVLVLAGCGGQDEKALVEKGRVALADKNHKAAAIAFKSALQIAPDSKEARVLLGRALVEDGDWRGAIVELSKALDEKANPDLVMPLLAQAMLDGSQAKKLVDTYDKTALTDKAAKAAFRTSIAAAWASLGEAEKSESALQEALQAVPDYPDALNFLARRLMLSGDLDRAGPVVDKVVAQSPKSPKALLLKGDLLTARQSFDSADKAFLEAIDIEKDYLPAHLGLVLSRLRAGDLPAARRYLSSAQKILPNHLDVLFLNAQLAFFEKNYAAAKESVQLLLRAAPSNTKLLQLAAAVEWQIGSLVIAERYLSTALTADPSLDNVRVNLAQIYNRLGQPAKALYVVDRLVKSPSGDASAFVVAGDAALQLGRTKQAENYYSAASKVLPDDTRTATALAMAQLVSGESGAAFAQLEALSKKDKEGIVDAALVSARLGRREVEQALKTADGMVARFPDRADAHELRGRVLVFKGDRDLARQAFERSLSIDPRRVSVATSLAQLDFADEKYDRAAGRYEAIIKADPKNDIAIALLADLRLKTGAPVADVQRLLMDAIKQSPESPELRVKLIDLLISKRKVKEALTLSQESAAALPNDVTVLDALGRSLLADNNGQQALATYRRILAINPDLAAAHMRMADVHRAGGDLGAAVASLRRVLEIDPKQREARIAFVDLLVSFKRSKEALELASDLQRREPDSAAGYLLEGAVQRKLLKHDAAAAAYRKGLSSVADPGELPMSLFASLLAAGKWKAAEAFALGWLDKNPSDGGMAYHLGEGYMINQNLPAAETYFAKAVAIRPDSAAALNNLASMLIQQRKPGGLQYARRAVQLEPGSHLTLDTLASALAAEGQTAEALKVQRRAVEAAPSLPVLRLNMAKIAIQAGDSTTAKAELEAVIAAGAKSPLADQASRLLRSL